jgi:hypothetical protein
MVFILHFVLRKYFQDRNVSFYTFSVKSPSIFASGGQKPFEKRFRGYGLPKTFYLSSLLKSFSGGPGGRFFKKAPLAAGGKN